MKILAIPNFGERISPRLDYAESIQLIKIEGKEVLSKENIKIIAHNNLDRINYIIELNPDVIICDGVSTQYLEKILKANIEVISWVHGNVNEILDKYLLNQLKTKKVKKENK